MSKDQEKNKKLLVENVDNFKTRSTFALNYQIRFKNYCYCVYAEKIYKNCNISLSKKKFKTLNAAKMYLSKIKQNPKVSLSYMCIIASGTF